MGSKYIDVEIALREIKKVKGNLTRLRKTLVELQRVQWIVGQANKRQVHLNEIQYIMTYLLEPQWRKLTEILA